MYSLTPTQKTVLQWLVQQIRDDKFSEDIRILWTGQGVAVVSSHKKASLQAPPEFTRGVVDAFVRDGLLLSSSPTAFTITGKAYEAVDSNFGAPDTSFIRHLTPLADITNLDGELKSRCLPILGAGSADPRLWDSAVRTAGVILEERLRDVGSISDPRRIGRDLVNDVLGQTGTLAAKFTNDSERVGYRDMFAGVVGAFRNPSAHHLIDPTPEDGGAFIVFINLLLRKLENLR